MSFSNTTETALPGNTSLPTPKSVLEALSAYENKSAYSVEDFFRLPEKTAFRLSPDGTKVAFLGPFERRQNIFVQTIGNDEVIQITQEKKRNIAGYLWANNNRLIYVKDSAGDENFQLYAVDSDGANARDLTPFDNVRIQMIDDLPDHDNELIIGMNKNNPALFEPYRINILDGTFKQLAINDNPLEPIDHWMTDHDGKLRIANQVVDGTTNVLLFRASENDNFEEVTRTDFKTSIHPLLFDFENPAHVWVSSNLNRDKSVVIKYDMLAKKEIGEPLYSHDKVDVSNIGYSRRHKKLVFVHYNFEKGHYHFIDEERKQMHERLKTELGDVEITIASANKEETKFIIKTSSDLSRGAYYYFDTKTDKLELISQVSPWINPEDMVPMKPISYQSRDGLTIHGYLSLPKGKNKDLPIIVNPHGGPWHRDNWRFNPEVQLFASQGYGVFQMNFRGSVGYGRDFWEKSFKQWGLSMQDDITDGVNWLIEQGIADPKRIAIYGGSYGGYATLAGLAFTPDLYACGIDYVGVSNLFTFFTTIPPYWKPYLEMMYTMVGHPEKDAKQLEATSPALQQHKIKAPLFVVQGANDPRVNIDEADQIVSNMRARKIDVPYMVKYDEGHGFSNEENTFEMYKAALGFLKKHLG